MFVFTLMQLETHHFRKKLYEINMYRLHNTKKCKCTSQAVGCSISSPQQWAFPCISGRWTLRAGVGQEVLLEELQGLSG